MIRQEWDFGFLWQQQDFKAVALQSDLSYQEESFFWFNELGLSLLTCRGESSISALKCTPKNEPCEYGSMTFSHSVVVTFIRPTFVHSASSNQLQSILSDRISLRIQYSRCFRTQGNGALNPRAALLSTHLKNRTGMGIFAEPGTFFARQKPGLASITPNKASDDSQPPRPIPTTSADPFDSRS